MKKIGKKIFLLLSLAITLPLSGQVQLEGITLIFSPWYKAEYTDTQLTYIHPSGAKYIIGPKDPAYTYFCRNNATAGEPASLVPAFADSSNKKVRCFAYTESNFAGDGKCFVYNLDSNNPPTANIDLSKWIPQTSKYCADLGFGGNAGLGQVSAGVRIADSLFKRLFVTEPALFINNTTNFSGVSYPKYIKYKTAPNGAEINLAPTNPGNNLYYCKSVAQASPPSPGFPQDLPAINFAIVPIFYDVRCFIATPNTGFSEGTCKVLNINLFNPPTNDISLTQWIPRPAAYCASEGGFHYNNVIMVGLAERLAPLLPTNTAFVNIFTEQITFKLTETETLNLGKRVSGSDYNFFCKPSANKSPVEGLSTIELPEIVPPPGVNVI